MQKLSILAYWHLLSKLVHLSDAKLIILKHVTDHQAHPDLFPIDSPHITIDAFHIQGSRILSRSFTVPLHRFGRSQSQTRSDSNSEMEGDGEEEEEVVVMIPFADMLNAAWGKDNAHLYIDEDTNEGFNEGVVMKSIQLVKQSEQIVGHLHYAKVWIDQILI